MLGRPQTTVEYTGEDRSPWGDLKLIGGTANPALCELIGADLGVALTDPRIRRFSDGELDVKIQDSMRGHDVFVIQPTCPPVNEHLMELFILLDALRRASAGRITAVVPYYGYARKERKTQPREPISAKLMANFLTLAGADRLLLLDLHTEAIEGFFDVPTDHLTAHRILADYVRGLGLHRVGWGHPWSSPTSGGPRPRSPRCWRWPATSTVATASWSTTSSRPAAP
jgi:ribose-phosphate pyrophosphokinase